MTTMQTKAGPPIDLLRGRGATPLIEACFEVHHLKQLYRQGWLRRGIPPERCESVAEHTFGVAMLALFLADRFPELDPLKTVRMALLHDLGEALAGDLTPAHGVSREEKHRLELEGAKRILDRMPNGALYLALYEEYERQDSPEARFVKQLDRLEMALQASVYEQQGLGDLGEFFQSTRQATKDPRLWEVLQPLLELRRKAPPEGWTTLLLTRRDAPGSWRIPRGRRVVLGRRPPADLVIPEVTVSSRHADFDVRDDGAWLQDAGSTSGIYLNEALIGGLTLLKEGDRLQIGHLHLEVHYVRD